MTDSDSLRGDPNYDPTRRHHPEIRELDALRELLRPRMAATGDASSTEALHGLITELEATSGLVGRAVEHWAPTFRARLCELLCSTQGGHGGGTMQELFDELVSVVKDMNKNVLAERKLARAAAEGHETVTSRLHDATERLRNAYITIDMQAHAITNLNRELRMASERSFNNSAERRGEVDAFGDALSMLYQLWPGWSPRETSSPIAIFHDVITEIQKRHPHSNLSS